MGWVFLVWYSFASYLQSSLRMKDKKHLELLAVSVFWIECLPAEERISEFGVIAEMVST